MGGSKAKDKRDIYYRAGKEFGFRARSAFKLLQMEETFHIFKPHQHHNHHDNDTNHTNNVTLRIVDLCSAPGAWTEVCRMMTSMESQIIAVDLQSMNPIQGVTFIKGDITRQST